MSKRSLFWGMASGKLGEAVFYRAGGEQRTRAWVPKIKNPKTLAQVENRLCMLNLVTAYRQWSEIIKTGWPLKKSNQSDYNAFVSANKDATTSVISKEIADAGYSVPENMVITKGDTDLVLTGSIDGVITGAGEDMYAVIAKGLNVTRDVFTGEELARLSGTSESPITGADVYKALVGTDNRNNLPAEFRLFVCRGMITDVEAPAGAPDLFGCGIAYSYITCSANSVDTPHSRGIAPIVFSLAEATTAEVTSVQLSGLMLSEPSSAQENGDSGVFTCIISYTQDGKQKVSTSTFYAYNGLNADVFAEYKPGGAVYEYALKSMGYNPDSLLATK